MRLSPKASGSFPHAWRPSPFKTSGDVEQWHTSLRALGIKLAVISVCSLACKAVMVALKLFRVVANCSSLHLSMSTPLVQALPSPLAIAVLVSHYSGSVGAARGRHVGACMDCARLKMSW
jgi:hypothetical protein